MSRHTVQELRKNLYWRSRANVRIREFKLHLYGKRKTSENEQIKTAQNGWKIPKSFGFRSSSSYSNLRKGDAQVRLILNIMCTLSKKEELSIKPFGF